MSKSRTFRFHPSDMDPIAWDTLQILHSRFYGSTLPLSSITSSHWKLYGKTQKADYDTGDVLSLQGVGFGDYENSSRLTTFERIKNLLPSITARLFLSQVPKEFRVIAKNLAAITDRTLNQDLVRLTKSAEIISRYINELQLNRVMIIGDGYGTLGSLLSKIHPELLIIQVNLGRTLLFDLAFSAKALRGKSHELIGDLSSIKFEAINYVPAEDVLNIDVKIDLFISIESFQEMDIQVVQGYFSLMRMQSTDTFLYSANRLSKILPDSSEIRKENYGWQPSDKILFERNPWWLNWGIRRGPPFIFRMDGLIEETMVELSH